MSNPYAPPEDRQRGAPAGRGPATPSSTGAVGAPAPTSTGGTPGAPSPAAGPLAPSDRSPAGVPYERPRARRQEPAASPADVLRAAALLRWTAFLVLVAVIGDLFPYPWFLAAGVVGIGSLVVGGRGLALAVRTRQRAPRAVLILLVVVALLGLTRPGTALLTWDAESSYARCQAAALTVQAQHACVSEYQRALDARVAQLKTRTP